MGPSANDESPRSDRAIRAALVTREGAALLFEDLARQPGLVGITARFAKARLMLKLGGNR